jgi:hypothetical protein
MLDGVKYPWKGELGCQARNELHAPIEKDFASMKAPLDIVLAKLGF